MNEHPSQEVENELPYKQPPVIQRMASVIAEIPPEHFAARIDSWKQIAMGSFPVDNPIVQWVLEADEIKVGEDIGIPAFESVMPQVKVTQHLERRNERNKTVWSMRCPAEGFILSLHGEKGKPHSFEELQGEMSMWLQRWVSHFEVKGFTTVMLDYVNLLGRRTTPKFVDDSSNSLEIDRLLNVFSRFEGSHVSLVQPYDCQASFLYTVDPVRVLRVRVHGLPPSRHGTEVRVDFSASMNKAATELVTPAEAVNEFNILHSMVIERFNRVFTDEAKESFR